MNNIKKIISLIFWVVAVIALLVLVDFRKLEFKEPQSPSATQKTVAEVSDEIIRNQPETESQNKEFEGTTDEIIALVNQARLSAGKSPLKKNELLMQSALLKAEDMKEKGYFDHESSEGLKYWFFVDKVGYKYSVVGENLAEGYFSSQEVHQAWMESEGHRKNILSDSYIEIGVAVIAFEQNGQKSYLAVQHFAAPLNADALPQKTVCELKSKEHCENAKQQLEDVEKLIKKQDEIIDDAEDEGANQQALKKAKKNLEALKKTRADLEEYLEKCEDFMKNCDQWQ